MHSKVLFEVCKRKVVADPEFDPPSEPTFARYPTFSPPFYSLDSEALKVSPTVIRLSKYSIGSSSSLVM